MTRFVFDINALISAFLIEESVPGQALRSALNQGVVLVSAPLLTTLAGVLQRPKFDRYLTLDEREDRAKRVLTRAVQVPLPPHLAGVPAAASEAKRVILDGQGAMLLQPDYRWDGASGLTIDTVSARRAALAHDACYTLLRQRRLGASGEAERKLADLWLWDLLLEDGMWKFRAAYWHWAVCRFGASAAGM